MLTNNNQIFMNWFVIIHRHLKKVSAQIIQCIIFERNEISIALSTLWTLRAKSSTCSHCICKQLSVQRVIHALTVFASNSPHKEPYMLSLYLQATLLTKSPTCSHCICKQLSVQRALHALTVFASNTPYKECYMLSLYLQATLCTKSAICFKI